jgi:hypothetical protein
MSVQRVRDDQIKITNLPEGRLTNVSGVVGAIKENLAAIAAPTGTDNFAAGYAVGSRWIYNDIIYDCTGDGEWHQIYPAILSGGTTVESIHTYPTGTKNGVNTVFTLAAAITDGDLVTHNGQVLEPAVDYTVSGVTLTFLTFAPEADDKIEVRRLNGNAYGGASGLLRGAITGTKNGVNTSFTLPAVIGDGDLVLKNGQVLALTTDYTYTGTSLTMVVPPDSTDSLEARYMSTSVTTEISTSWGLIGGDITDQTDLQAELDAKQDITTLLTNFLSAATSATTGQAVVKGTGSTWSVVDLPEAALQYLETVWGNTASGTEVTVASSSALAAGTYLCRISCGSIGDTEPYGVGLGYRIDSGSTVWAGNGTALLNSFLWSVEITVTAAQVIHIRGLTDSGYTCPFSMEIWGPV